MSPNCRRVLESLTTDAALLTQLIRVLEQNVLLEMVAFLEPVTDASITVNQCCCQGPTSRGQGPGRAVRGRAQGQGLEVRGQGQGLEFQMLKHLLSNDIDFLE